MSVVQIATASEVPVVVKVCGFAGQALFAARMIVQWIASERQQRSVIPRVFWSLSVAGSALILIYAGFKRDVVYLLSSLTGTFIYLRNIRLSDGGDRTPTSRRVLVPILLALLVVTGLALARTVHVTDAVGWLLVGLLGNVAWLARFVIQWWASERSGRSVAPRAFWVASLLGSTLLLAYSIRDGDLVFILAYATGPPIYLRNLWLMKRAVA